MDIIPLELFILFLDTRSFTETCVSHIQLTSPGDTPMGSLYLTFYRVSRLSNSRAQPVLYVPYGMSHLLNPMHPFKTVILKD